MIRFVVQINDPKVWTPLHHESDSDLDSIMAAFDMIERQTQMSNALAIRLDVLTICGHLENLNTLAAINKIEVDDAAGVVKIIFRQLPNYNNLSIRKIEWQAGLGYVELHYSVQKPSRGRPYKIYIRKGNPMDGHYQNHVGQKSEYFFKRLNPALEHIGQMAERGVRPY